MALTFTGVVQQGVQLALVIFIMGACAMGAETFGQQSESAPSQNQLYLKPHLRLRSKVILQSQ